MVLTPIQNFLPGAPTAYVTRRGKTPWGNGAHPSHRFILGKSSLYLI
eukprot:UN24646